MQNGSQFRYLFKEIRWAVSGAREGLLDQSVVSRVKQTVRRSPIQSVTPTDQSLNVAVFSAATAGIYEVQDNVSAYACV